MTLRRLVPPAIRHAIRDAWNGYRLNRAIRELKRMAPGTVPTDAFLARLRRAFGNEGWSGDVAYLRAVCEYAVTPGGPILECGSGTTTILLSALVPEQRPRISLEHLGEWHQKVERVLSRHGLPSHLHHLPLRDYDGFAWYADDFLGPGRSFSLVICDGPPDSTPGGRYGLLPVCRDHLAEDCVILLDDVERPGERAIVEGWRREFGLTYQVESTPRGDHAVARLGTGG